MCTIEGARKQGDEGSVEPPISGQSESKRIERDRPRHTGRGTGTGELSRTTLGSELIIVRQQIRHCCNPSATGSTAAIVSSVNAEVYLVLDLFRLSSNRLPDIQRIYTETSIATMGRLTLSRSAALQPSPEFPQADVLAPSRAMRPHVVRGKRRALDHVPLAN